MLLGIRQTVGPTLIISGASTQSSNQPALALKPRGPHLIPATHHYILRIFRGVTRALVCVGCIIDQKEWWLNKSPVLLHDMRIYDPNLLDGSLSLMVPIWFLHIFPPRPFYRDSPAQTGKSRWVLRGVQTLARTRKSHQIPSEPQQAPRTCRNLLQPLGGPCQTIKSRLYGKRPVLGVSKRQSPHPFTSRTTASYLW